jgi:hypothetical protein
MSTHRKPRARIAGLLSLLALLSAAASASAATPPRWNVSLRSFPGTLVRGSAPESGASGFDAVPQYRATIVNSGEEATTGPIVITETLPTGVGVTGSPSVEIEPAGTCETPSSVQVVCQMTGSVAPGGQIRLAVPVEVSGSAPSPGTAKVEVSGGGADPASATKVTGIARKGGPRWLVSSRSYPTVFVPGSVAKKEPFAYDSVPEYSTVITNAGAGTAGEEQPDGSREPIVVTQTLPPGITVPAGQTPFFQGGSCELPSPQEVLCESEKSIGSGSAIFMAIPLEVSESAPSPAVSRVEVSGGGAPPAALTMSAAVSDQAPEFGFLSEAQGATGHATAESGLDANLAGSHPYSVALETNYNNAVEGYFPSPSEDLRNLQLQLPQGMVINPQAPTELCTEAELASLESTDAGKGGCPRASQVGTITVQTIVAGLDPLSLSLYAMEAPPGEAAQFGFDILGTLVHIEGGLDGSFRLVGGSRDILAKYVLFGIKVEFWGDPADPNHDPARRGSGGCGDLSGGCPLLPSEANKVPFLTMPTSCGDPLSLGATALSWVGTSDTQAAFFRNAEGEPLATAGCNALAFEPTIASKATTNAGETPSGLEFSIHQPQNEDVEGRSTAALKDARVSLPEGMALNPAAANGLDACSEGQMGYAPEGPKVQFTTTPQSCPAAAKVGTVEVKTPLVDHKLPGAVYVAKSFDNPFGSLLAIYLAVEDEETGIIAKLAGKVEPDPQSGRLTATFTENPEQPLEDIEVHFFGGEHGVLTTPLACGSHETSSTLTPWSSPEGADAHPSDSFQTTAACSADEAAAPKDVSFTAGTVSPLAGAYSPFVLRLARKDGSQHITGIDTTLPEGLVGKLAGIPYCPEGAIALAKSREAPEKGKEEQASPSCPAASEVGAVQVTAGSGISPIPVTGHAYLAGPYEGAPLSMVVIVPAVAGPFDLGNVVSRVALHVGEYDARIHAVSDPLPTILDGIPLDVRSIELKLDRPGFTLNPTSCEEASIEGAVTTQAGQTAPLKDRFQVGECGRLPFKPKLALSLKGKTTRAAHPALKAVVTLPPGGANLARIQVGLPHSEFLDQGNLSQVCTQGQLKSQTCPARAVYGHVKVWTPLIEAPLEGPVYLGVGFGYQLPALVAELNGQIRLLSAGKVDTTKKHGLRNTFEAVPDAPVEKIVLEMKGGPKYGLLQNSENICNQTQRAAASFTAANGKVVNLQPKIANGCKAKKKHKGHGHKKKRGRR